MKKIIYFLVASLTLFASPKAIFAQPERWQQRAEYQMNIDFDVKKHQFDGEQTLNYYNNSPDTLTKVFYHLYFNAFQPNSDMDIRSRTIADPDGRVGSRISKLNVDEIGFQKINSLKQNGKKTSFEVVGTVLEVTLAEPILPNSKTVFEMKFKGQIPVQIRRCGRDNKEGVDYSMSQWYPKMAEYDYQGWHADPYIGREFYGVFGDFDVTIEIDKNYVVAAGAYLQNPLEVGCGYEEPNEKLTLSGKKTKKWHFKSSNVHDFMWAADRDYTHTKLKTAFGTTLHFFYQKNEKTAEAWEKLPAVMEKAMAYANENFGKYPYKDFYFVQGGDGGMEYPMATLIVGEGGLQALVSVSVHEMMHSWFQGVLASNESLYSWMDEGFTSYATTLIMSSLEIKSKGNAVVEDRTFESSYKSYAGFQARGKPEALCTHSDHFNTNSAYGVASYVNGSIFLSQLEYIIGKKALDATMLRYFETWKFKHPNPNDFIRVAEKQSGIELDWYKEYWINSTNTIDYAIDTVSQAGRRETKIILSRKGKMPMPIDVVVTDENGKKYFYNIPLQLMRGSKPNAGDYEAMTTEAGWSWVNPTYELTVPVKFDKINKIEIDPSGRMADVKRDNNIYKKKEIESGELKK